MLAQGAASEANKPWAGNAEHMKTVILLVAVLVVTLVLMAFTSWLFPKKPEPPDEMKDLHNPDGIVGVLFLGHGCIGIVIVFACAILFGLI